MKLRALQTLDYNNRRYAKGAVFEPASDGSAEVLLYAKLATEVKEEPPPSPELPPKLEVEEDKEPPKRKQYKTRRMRAEDE
jgi:hypothetical protein